MYFGILQARHGLSGKKGSPPEPGPSEPCALTPVCDTNSRLPPAFHRILATQDLSDARASNTRLWINKTGSQLCAAVLLARRPGFRVGEARPLPRGSQPVRGPRACPRDYTLSAVLPNKNIRSQYKVHIKQQQKTPHTCLHFFLQI